MTPAARSLAVLRELGYTAEVVERWIPRVKVRRDLFGCIDILAILNHGILGVQATTGTNAATRCNKAQDEPRLRTWLCAGAAFEVWSWRLAGQRGKRKLWTLTRKRAALNGNGISWITLADTKEQP